MKLARRKKFLFDAPGEVQEKKGWQTKKMKARAASLARTATYFQVVPAFRWVGGDSVPEAYTYPVPGVQEGKTFKFVAPLTDEDAIPAKQRHNRSLKLPGFDTSRTSIKKKKKMCCRCPLWCEFLSMTLVVIYSLTASVWVLWYVLKMDYVSRGDAEYNKVTDELWASWLANVTAMYTLSPTDSRIVAVQATREPARTVTSEDELLSWAVANLFILLLDVFVFNPATILFRALLCTKYE